MARWIAGVVVAIALVSCGGADSRNGIGGPCIMDGNCHVGLICVADDPGGQCTKFCTEDAECAEGDLCDSEGKCYKACHSDSDCPRALTDPRYGCLGNEPRKVCDARDSSDGGASD